MLESTKEEREYDLLAAGETGDDSLTSIPFQVDFFHFGLPKKKKGKKLKA